MDEADELSKFLIDWGKRHGYTFILPNGRGDKPIDFFSINIKTKTIYVDELDINEPLTEAG